MDDKRDISKGTNFERFFDQAILKTNPFGENRSADRAFQKAERLAAGLYLLTNHIDADEPIRNAVRDGALELILRALSLRNEMRSADSPRVYDLRASIRSLISQVRMLTVSGLVSIQNAGIVIESLDELGVLVTASQRSSLSESVVLSKEDFEIQASFTPKHHARNVLKDIKDSTIEKDNATNVKDVNMSNKSTAGNARSQAILSLLRASGELGIRDIASHMPEYSDKMIQRELADLVAIGQVKKKGDKRWSKYSIPASSV